MKFTLKRETSGSEVRVGRLPQVNLLPRAIAAKREQTKILKQWAVRVSGALVVLVLATVSMLAWQGVTVLQLGVEKAEELNLLNQISTKADIQRLVSAESALKAFEAEAMSTDIGWVHSIGLMLEKFPEDAVLCGFDLTTGAAPGSDPAAEIGLSGNIAICGTFRSAIPYLRDATSIPSVMSAIMVSGEKSGREGIYVHNIWVEFDQTIYLSIAGADSSANAAEEPAEEEPNGVELDDNAKAAEESFDGAAESTPGEPANSEENAE